MSEAATNEFTNGGSDNSWTNTANCSLTAVPVAADVVYVDKYGANGLEINATNAMATSLTLGTNTDVNSSVAIGPGAKLTLNGDIGSGNSNNSKIRYFVNEGELDAASITLRKGKNTFTNSGTIVCSGKISVGSTGSTTKFYNTGDITCGVLSIGLNTQNAFVYMLGGTINGTTLQGNSSNDGGHVDLHGGTMTFTDVGLFDPTWVGSPGGYGYYTMDVQRPGILIVEGTNLTSEFKQAITDGHITGHEDLRVSYKNGNTIVSCPLRGTAVMIR